MKLEFEIYVDDVVCLYGLILGVIDEEGLFYLCVCGVFKDIVIDFMILVFFVEVVEEIEFDDLFDVIILCLESWLECCCG